MTQVEFPSNGSTAPGYLSTPTSGSGIPVVVLQKYWGLEDHIRDVCDRWRPRASWLWRPTSTGGRLRPSPTRPSRR